MALPTATFHREILALACSGHNSAAVRHALSGTDQWLARSPIAATGTPYGRSPQYQDARGEIMLAGWRNGAVCAPHDHADAQGIVIVIAGYFTETRYCFEAGSLRAVGTTTASAGSALAVTPGLIHDMRCDQSGTTLHVYAPPIREMRVFDASARRTLTLGPDLGAWIPTNPRDVIHADAWTSASVNATTQ